MSKKLVSKSLKVIRTQGVGVFCRKTKEYLHNRKLLKKHNVTQKQKTFDFMDALFINGCYLPHPSRYRVTHQREQLFANNFITNEVFYTDIDPVMIKYYRVFIFFRCVHTEEIEKFIKEAKAQNKVVLYDIDDLVIDLKYTNTIKYLKTIKADRRKDYNESINQMQRLLRLCDGAITTTKALADELKNYVPEVYINRNTASDTMVQRSEWVVYDRDILPFKEKKSLEKHEHNSYDRALKIHNKRCKSNMIRIGYFSGSITHNADITMILPVIKKIMEKYENVEFHFVGELDIPKELSEFKDRIFASNFVDWTLLPGLIASVDINISPLEDTIFNRAKSENKWVEAALVKVPTVASNLGAMEEMIEHNKTGILCSDNDEWFSALELLINDKEMRVKLAKNAYDFAIKNCYTLNTGLPLTNYLRSKMSPNIALVLPSTHISGGVLVVLRHCLILKEAGFDVLIISDSFDADNIRFNKELLYVISTRFNGFHGRIDKAVATLWATLTFVSNYLNIGERYYLVQNYETNFYKPGNFFKFKANQTYSSIIPVNYITISKWCQNWLKDDYNQDARYAPNGIDVKQFDYKKRVFSKDRKVRILVEGNSDDYYKNVDESFEIIKKLDESKFEVWYLSYMGKPKSWYRVDKFFHKVPYAEVAKIYSDCDILLKSSILESFSYPPLEMMATGGFVVVRPNEGNIEYLEDNYNCLMYYDGDIDEAVEAIGRICSDEDLRKKLNSNGSETVKSRSWDNITEDILNLYRGNNSV